MQERKRDDSGMASRTGLWLGLAVGAAAVAAYAWRSTRTEPVKARRFADRGEDRRNPLHFFLAGNFPRRRRIDRSGRRPLFERRASVYDTY
jgi:hypothetical protein